MSTSYTGPTDTNWNRGAIINSYSDQCSGVCSGSGMTDNNGNLKKQEVYIPNDDQISGSTMRSQQYDYDSLNRLLSAREVLNGTEQWKQQFTYDRWGNRTINTGVTYGTGINNKAFTVDTSNNRLGVPVGQSGVMSYDASGNLTNDTYAGAGNRIYDAENKITSAWGGNNQAQLYGYDASGQRIKRTVDGVTTWQVYGFGGELIAEYAANGAATSPQKEYGYRNGQLLVTAEPTQAQQSTQNVSWTNATGVSVSGNNLTKNTTDNWGNSGASSSQAIVSGDGYVELTATETNKWRMIGLSNGDSNLDFTDIDFAAYLSVSGNNLCIYEAGTSRGCVSTYNTGDTIRVAVESGVVKYKKNGAVVNTSTVAPSYPLLVDTAFWSNGATINNVVISGNLSGGSGSGTSVLHWLVSDHLSTPRMIIDQTGTLANVKRHDYLPFGEELFAGAGRRNSTLGYSGGDGIRQQFTSKERDVETRLDYFFARYYSPTQGRFIMTDHFDGNPSQLSVGFDSSPSMPYANLMNPQTLNLYAYILNDPLSNVDEDGHQGGKMQPLPGNNRYQIRPDLRNPNDSPNIHVFDGAGRREIGKVKIKPNGNEWSGKVPESVKTTVEEYIRVRGIQPRLPGEPLRPDVPPETGGTGRRILGGTNNALGILAFIIGAISEYRAERDAEINGYYLNYQGQIVITDLARAAQHFPQGYYLEFGGHVWKPQGNTWVPLDNCGCELEIKGGDLRVIYRTD